MYFSDIVIKIGKGNFDFEEGAEYIFVINESKYKIAFDFSKAFIVVGEIEKKFNLTRFSDFSFKTIKSNQEGVEDSCALVFEGEELFSLPESNMGKHKELFSQLAELFTNDEQCSPKFQIESMKNLYDIDFSNFGAKNTNKFLLLYKNKFESIVNDEFIKADSKMLMMLEEDSGKVMQNFGQTAKKNLNVGKLFGRGLGGLIETGIGLAKAAGGRIIQGFLSDLVGDKDLLLLTNKNVIIAKKDSINEYDFDDAFDLFKSRPDEVLAGVVDIYDDCENLVINNISQTDWNIFRAQLRKLRKEAEYSNNVESNSENAFAEIESKLTKLKSLVEKGLLSQDDFEAKKSDLLSSL